MLDIFDLLLRGECDPKMGLKNFKATIDVEIKNLVNKKSILKNI